jgi:hypothetical protein
MYVQQKKYGEYQARFSEAMRARDQKMASNLLFYQVNIAVGSIGRMRGNDEK